MQEQVGTHQSEGGDLSVSLGLASWMYTAPPRTADTQRASAISHSPIYELGWVAGEKNLSTQSKQLISFFQLPQVF